jgi:hypothetical protein
MKNDNFYKTKLAESLLPERIIIPKESLLPESNEIVDYRIEQTAKWCYIEDCSENVLPRIVEKRQGRYVPPRIRNTQPRNRQIARATGL